MVDSLYDHDLRLQQAIKSVKRSPHLSTRKKRLVLRYKDEMLAKPGVARP